MIVQTKILTLFVGESFVLAMAFWAITFTPADVTAYTLALAALITAIGTSVATIMAARSTRKKLDEVGVNTAETLIEAKVIKGHVNSAATYSASKIESLENELRLLREVVADKKETASLLAQAAVQTTTVPAALLPHDQSTKANLQEIEKNTEDTAKNTARTDETVQELKDKP